MLDESGGQARVEVPWRLAPGTEVAGFTIEGLIASGSFGTVYRARRGERRFAIKLVPIDPRGDREVAALRLMRHPNVVCFHGYGLWPEEEPRFLVLALELVEGRPLDVWAWEENPSALELVIQVLLPLALLLAEVHASGVVHRDIKEANIVVREADGQPVLVDFGAAGLEGAPRLTMRLPPGTAEYRSPEALRFAREWEGESYPFTPGDDLWAMGVVTYFLLTRTLAFGDRNDPGLNQAILQETPPAPHELNPRVPPALSELCMRMLEKEPGARYADARELADELSGEWAHADRSWRVPLFPGDGREKSPALAPAVPGHQAPGGGWVAGLVLTAMLVLGVFSLLTARGWQLSMVPPSAQRVESPPPFPPHQASPRQEIAPDRLTGEVVRGAAPAKSPTPAPAANAANSEDPKMTKSQKTRSLVAAGCVLGSACASGPQLRQPPKPEACPAGADITHERFNLSRRHGLSLVPIARGGPKIVPVQEGEVKAEIIGDWRGFPQRTTFSGRLYIGNNRVYGRFTQAHLPGGKTVPVCLEMMRDYDLGIPMEPESTRDTPYVFSSFSVDTVDHFQ